MASISYKYKCIFVHIPRCAGTAIKKKLFDNLGGHRTIREWRKEYPVQEKEFFTFSFVRNPWDRLVSNFEYARMEESFWHGGSKVVHPKYALLKNKTFEELVDLLYSRRLRIDHLRQRQGNRHFFSQSFFIGDGSCLNFVGRYERLQSDFQKICNELHIESSVVCLMNKSVRRPYQEYYTDETINKVAQIYQNDIRNFNYYFTD